MDRRAAGTGAVLFAVFLGAGVPASSAQEAVDPSENAPASAHIQDNSFLVEEAYNQEAGVGSCSSTYPSNIRFMNEELKTDN